MQSCVVYVLTATTRSTHSCSLYRMCFNLTLPTLFFSSPVNCLYAAMGFVWSGHDDHLIRQVSEVSSFSHLADISSFEFIDSGQLPPATYTVKWKAIEDRYFPWQS